MDSGGETAGRGKDLLSCRRPGVHLVWKHFFCYESDGEQVSPERLWSLLLAELQKPPGCDPGHPAGGDPAWAGAGAGGPICSFTPQPVCNPLIHLFCCSSHNTLKYTCRSDVPCRSICRSDVPLAFCIGPPSVGTAGWCWLRARCIFCCFSKADFAEHLQGLASQEWALSILMVAHTPGSNGIKALRCPSENK